MSLRLGDTAPNFTAETTEGPLRFYEWMEEGWAVLFSHPKGFTPVCTTELGEVARLQSQFVQRGVKVIGLSVDPLPSDRNWISDTEETQACRMNFPLIADHDRTIANLYGMIHPNANGKSTVFPTSFQLVGKRKPLGGGRSTYSANQLSTTSGRSCSALP